MRMRYRRETETYLFHWDANQDEQVRELLRTLGRMAGNPELSFTWYDAVVLSERVRKSWLLAER